LLGGVQQRHLVKAGAHEDHNSVMVCRRAQRCIHIFSGLEADQPFREWADCGKRVQRMIAAYSPWIRCHSSSNGAFRRIHLRRLNIERTTLNADLCLLPGIFFGVAIWTEMLRHGVGRQKMQAG